MHSCLAKVPIFQHLSEEEMAYVHEFIRPKSFQKVNSFSVLATQIRFAST
jgi:hypothetical protein